jgi:hypothetical protein
MKKSELKNEIKNYIYEILSEEEENTDMVVSVLNNPNLDKDVKTLLMKAYEKGDLTPSKVKDIVNNLLKEENEGNVVMKKGTNPNDIKKVTAQGIDVELREEEDSTLDDETIDKQAKAAAKKEKIQGPSKFKVPNSEFEDFKTKLKNLVTKIKNMEKGPEKDKKMAALKQFIKKPELVKAFKERDVQIDTGGLVGENKLNEIVTPPTFERLHNKEGIKGYTNNKHKIVRFAYDDEGNNAFALLNMKNKKLISYSLTGESERKKFNEYNKTLK